MYVRVCASNAYISNAACEMCAHKKGSDLHKLRQMLPAKEEGAAQAPLCPVITLLHIFSHVSDCTFFQTGHLCLADADLIGNLHLCASLKKAQAQDMLFAL